MKTEMKLTGETYPIRASLKGNGWRWDRASQAWVKTVQVPDEIFSKVSGQGREVPAGREFSKTFGANKRGCLCSSSNGCTIWFRSNEYRPVDSSSRAIDRAQAKMDRQWHSANGMPTKADLRNDPDYL